MNRDRQQTEQRLIDAVHELIIREGFDQVRINKLAQEAKVNKILIYRYFGGLNGLLEAYYAKYMPVTTAPLVDQKRLETISTDEFLQLCCDYLLEEFRDLRTNPQAQQVLKNDLIGYQVGAVNPLIANKEAQVKPLLDTMSRLVHAQHGRPLLAVMVSAMTMLTFLSQDKRTMLGIQLGTDKGWQEIEGAVQYLYDSLARFTLNPAPKPGATESISTDSQQPT